MTFRKTGARSILTLTLAISPIALFSSTASAQDEAPLFEARADASDGHVYFTLPRADDGGEAGCYIYASALRTGLGSPNIRLDRGMLGSEQLLCFRRMGSKVAAVFENPSFQAAGDELTQAGASESFAFTVAAMLPVVDDARDGLTVDMTPLLTADAVGISEALSTGETRYRQSSDLGAIDTTSLKVFPRNVEVDAVQTFTSDRPGDEVRRLAPDARQVSFIVHHSFIALPEPGFQTRLADPRAPVFGPTIYDFGAPLGEPLAVQLAARFRLEKTDPSAAQSEVVEPIIFYIDRAAPEPVRTALMEGVNYWAPAFERAGFTGGFRAEILPEGADPMDVRYNMVNWSNRLTRGWSYGGGIVDPRTGEIIKGNVVLGALRVRQDIAIFEGLVGTAQNGSGGPNDPVRAALDRIRQLGAHEVGHAIGFMHNFAGSTQDRTTVMDYPPPRILLTNGEIDLSQAYARGGGAWDDYSVDWLYGDPGPGQDPEAYAAQKAVAAQQAGLAFMTDIDGRDAADPSPVASMWDDGPDMVASLEHMLDVREVALANFGEGALLPGEPMAFLRRKFVPIWLLHRYDVEATGKVLGGLDFEYKVVGDNHPLPTPFTAATQRAAMDALIGTLSPAVLTVPDRLVPMLSVPSTRLDDPQFTTEVLRNAGSAAFDPMVAADVAAQITLESLLAPERLSRLAEQNRRDTSMPGPSELIDALLDRVVTNRQGEIGRRIAWRTIMTMAHTQRDDDTAPGVAALLGSRLSALGTRLANAGTGEDQAWASYVSELLGDEERLLRVLEERETVPEIPPGMPIGGSSDWLGG